MTLVRKTRHHEIALPNEVIEQFPGIEHFDVRVVERTIVLYPVHVDDADRVRAKLDELGIDEQDIPDAKRWAREESD